MSAPEAFYLKLLWPEYIDSDEKYVAIVIAGILTTRWDLDQNSLSLPPYSMHLTEVGMHLKVRLSLVKARDVTFVARCSRSRRWTRH